MSATCRSARHCWTARSAENIARMRPAGHRGVCWRPSAPGCTASWPGCRRATRPASPAQHLSSGQRQRVALARALYARPGLLVLDEPSAFLDRRARPSSSRLLARLRAEGATVLLVTHRPALLAAADKLVVLQDGAVAQFGPGRGGPARPCGSPARPLREPAVSAACRDRAPANAAASRSAGLALALLLTAVRRRRHARRADLRHAAV